METIGRVWWRVGFRFYVLGARLEPTTIGTLLANGSILETVFFFWGGGVRGVPRCPNALPGHPF